MAGHAAGNGTPAPFTSIGIARVRSHFPPVSGHRASFRLHIPCFMPLTYIQDERAALALAEELAGVDEFALDLEAAGFHRYSDRLCLVQVSTRERTWVVDPLAFDVRSVLQVPVEDPDIRTVMHGADFDLRLLDRDLDLSLRGLFDTQVAASLLGESAIGLASLLEKHLGVKLSKKHQKADWAQRPLPDELLAYAAADTRHLFELADRLRRKLEDQGRLVWALSECREMEGIRWEEPGDEDPVIGVKGARDLDPRELERLRAALEWRDEIARAQDRAAFRVAGDPTLLEVALRRPRSADELARIRGMSGRMAREQGEDLVRRLDRADALPAAELRSFPPVPRGRGRPPPEIEERTGRLKSARNRRAAELGIDRGTLLSNAVLEEIAREAPRSREALESVPGIKEWQVEATGDAVLSVLSSEEAA